MVVISGSESPGLSWSGRSRTGRAGPRRKGAAARPEHQCLPREGVGSEQREDTTDYRRPESRGSATSPQTARAKRPGRAAPTHLLSRPHRRPPPAPGLLSPPPAQPGEGPIRLSAAEAAPARGGRRASALMTRSSRRRRPTRSMERRSPSPPFYLRRQVFETASRQPVSSGIPASPFDADCHFL